MADYQAPGLYVKSVDSGSKPIEGVGINTCAFIGYTKSGPFNEPTFVSSWSHFCAVFGQDEQAVLKALADAFGLSKAEVAVLQKKSGLGLMAFAEHVIDKAVDDANASEKAGKSQAKRRFPMYRSQADENVKIETFSDFRKGYKLPASPDPFIERKKNVEGEDRATYGYLPHAVWGFFLNGGSRAYIVRVPHQEDIDYFVNDSRPKPFKNRIEAVTPGQVTSGDLTFITASGDSRDDTTVEIKAFGDKANNEFQFVFKHNGKDEIWPAREGIKSETLSDTLKTTPPKMVLIQTAPRTQTAPKIDITTKPLKLSPEIVVEMKEASSDLVPVLVEEAALEVPEPNPHKSDLVGKAGDFIGDESKRQGIYSLKTIEDVNMICAPDLMEEMFYRRYLTVDGKERKSAERMIFPDAGYQTRAKEILDAQRAMVAFCENRGDVMVILDPLPGQTPQGVKEMTANANYGSAQGQATLYYPWIYASDPLNNSERICVPPSGHIAGVWARVGEERGVHKAPANEILRGAQALAYEVTAADQAILNPDGINAVRSFSGEGIKVYGARTLATVGNQSWKYVNVRRLFNYLVRSVDRGMRWAVFEPNDHDLWGRLQRNIRAFLWTEWKDGKLFGATPEEAFYVKCDGDLNPTEQRDLGRVFVEVGVNPVKPAEFVIINIGQWDGGNRITSR